MNMAKLCLFVWTGSKTTFKKFALPTCRAPLLAGCVCEHTHSAYTMPAPEEHHALLRAVGVDPFASRSKGQAPLPLDLEAMRLLLSRPGLKADGCRDRQGTTLLGVAAFLGRVEAMQLLLEHGANVGAENLDGSTPLSMACFGKSAAAAAVLLVYGGDDVETSDAATDAHATGAVDVISVLEAWEEGEPHPLITMAERMHDASAPKLRALAEAKERAAEAKRNLPRRPSLKLLQEWQSQVEVERVRADIAEKRAEEAERRASLAEARVLELETLVQRTGLSLQGQPQPTGASISPPRGLFRVPSQRSNKTLLAGTPLKRSSQGTTSSSLLPARGSTKSLLLAAATKWKSRTSRHGDREATHGDVPESSSSIRRPSFQTYEVQSI